MSRIETIPHFQNCCLAFHRLTILDDLHGMQPMRVKTLSHLYLIPLLILNGEIYNHKQLGKQFGFNFDTKCDTEVILHLYKKFGVEMTAQMLDGVFAFRIVDTKKKEVLIARDTFGVRPLFTMTKTGEKSAEILALSSEAKALVPLMKNVQEYDGEMQINPFPARQYASYGLSSDRHTTFIKKKAYTEVGKPLMFETVVKIDSSEVMENIRNLFSEAVRKRLMSERRIGALLSRGLDSSLVASCLTELAKENGIDYPVQTFSIGMEGSTDIPVVRKVAEYIGK